MTRHLNSCRIIRVIALLIIVFASQPTPVHARSENVVQVVTESWPPHVYIDKKGNITGPMTERVETLLLQAGIEYQLALYPWPRTYNIAQTEKNVLVYPLYKNRDRLERFHFICPFAVKLDLFLFKLTNRQDIQLNTLEDAKRYTIGLVRNDHDHLMLKQQGFKDGKQIDANIDDENSLKKMLKGRLDLMVQSKKSMNRLLQRFNLSPDTASPALKIPTELTGENCIAMSLGSSPETVAKIRRALKQVNESAGVLQLE